MFIFILLVLVFICDHYFINVVVFKESRATNSTHFLFRSWFGHNRYALPHIYSSVGYRVVYFCLGFVRTFLRINEIQLHTSVVL